MSPQPHAGPPSCTDERAFATARVLLGLFYLAFTIFPQIEQDPVPKWLLVAYVVYALTAYVVTMYARHWIRWTTLAFHETDVLWPVAVSMAVEHAVVPGVPVFMLYAFAIVASGFRWGLRNTLITAAQLTIFLWLAAFLAMKGVYENRTDILEMHHLLTRTGYVWAIAAIAGYLGQQQVDLRSEISHVADILTELHLNRPWNESLSRVVRRIGDLLGTRHILIVCRNRDAGDIYLWDFEGDSTSTNGGSRRVRPEDTSDYRTTYLGNILKRPQPGQGGQLGLPLAGPDPIPGFLSDYEWKAAVTGEVNGRKWESQYYLLYPHTRIPPRSRITRVRRIIEQLAPAVENLYFLHEMRNQAATSARHEITRELHDGVLQSLFGIEMRLEVLRRHTADDTLAGELTELKSLIRSEQLEIRELLQRGKADEVTPDRLVVSLTDMVDKFGRDSNIAAQFVSNVRSVPLNINECRELARIVHEALVNVRKHSGARAVLVTLASEFDQVRLIIEDDGKGFRFSGRLGITDLETKHLGPAEIRDSVRRLKGNLVLESTPGHGSRLEVKVARDYRAIFRSRAA